MTEEEKKAIKYLEKDLRKADMLEMTVHTDNESVRIALNIIQKQQVEIEKQDKVMDLMADWIFNKDYCENSLLIHRDDYYSNCIKQVKQYFEKQGERK